MEGKQYRNEQPILVVGGGISGLAAAISLRRRGFQVLVFDKVAKIRDAGSGMSVIGHSLMILDALGVDLEKVCLKQVDVKLVNQDGTPAFNVPLMSDTELVARFGSVQYNVHRGELQEALLNVLEREGGQVLTGKRLDRFEYQGNHIVAYMCDGSMYKGCLLIGADGVHSATRRGLHPSHKLRYSGTSCWRGICTSPPPHVLQFGNRMYKTIIHPSGGRCSFTSGFTTLNRCFWVLDIVHPKDTYVTGEEAKSLVLKHMESFPREMRDIVTYTGEDEMVQTDVYDSNPYTWTDGRGVLLIGDAAHPVVHHFGQGACLALEDAISFVQHLDTQSLNNDGPLSPKNVQGAIAATCSWKRRFRASALTFISRWCGDIYLSNNFVSNFVLGVALSWPLSALFTCVMQRLLFVQGMETRVYADTVLRTCRPRDVDTRSQIVLSQEQNQDKMKRR